MLDGSFVIAKLQPGDYDAIGEADTVDINLLDPVLTDFSAGLAEMRAKFLGDLFPSSMKGAPVEALVEFFVQIVAVWRRALYKWI